MTMQFETQSPRSGRPQPRDLPGMGGFWLMLKSQTAGLQLLKSNGMRSHPARSPSHLVRTGAHLLRAGSYFRRFGKGLEGREGAKKFGAGQVQPPPCTAFPEGDGVNRRKAGDILKDGHRTLLYPGDSPFFVLLGDAVCGAMLRTALCGSIRGRFALFLLFTLISACLVGAHKTAMRRIGQPHNPMSVAFARLSGGKSQSLVTSAPTRVGNRNDALAEDATKRHLGAESRIVPAQWPPDMIHWITRFERYSKPLLMTLTLVLLAIIGWVDWVTGYELSIFVFYLIPVSLAVWFVGDSFGVITTVLCVIVWVLADWKAGAQYGPFIVVWNVLIAAVSLFVVRGLLARLRKSKRELEERVRQRTVALTSEINERARLEQELLRISEREQWRIGHDLHDSLGQHLTGTALAGHVLSEKLAEKSLPEAAAADNVVKLVEEAIDLTRTLARGLHPVDLEGENFLDSFNELAANVSERFKIKCRFECSTAAGIRPPEGAIHLYRIAQEAINNAIKHGKAKEIIIRLEKVRGLMTLSVEDDGMGFSERARGGPGMGW